MSRIEDRLTALEKVAGVAVHASVALPGSLAMATDIFDGAIDRLARRGIDVDARAHALLRIVERVTAPHTIDALEAVMASGILEARTLGTLGHVASALASLDDESARPVSLWSALRASSDPDVQRALGFLLSVAKGLGRALAESPTPQLPPARA